MSYKQNVKNKQDWQNYLNKNPQGRKINVHKFNNDKKTIIAMGDVHYKTPHTAIDDFKHNLDWCGENDISILGDTMSLDDKILKEIRKLNLSETEAKKVIKNLRNTNPNKYHKIKLPISEKHVKFGVLSDFHIGHQDYRPDVLRYAAKFWKKENLDFIVNTGDTIEGMSGRDGHIYELSEIGATAQLQKFESEFKVLSDWDVYSIESDNSHGGWFKSKGNVGLDIGEELSRRAPNYKFIGYDEQDLELDNGVMIRLRHPGGGTAYAISYKMQKYVESITGGKKPNIIIQGHFHKSMYMFYRNVHCFEAGALQNQSPFMRKIGTPSHVGFWTIEFWSEKKKSVGRVRAEFKPFYD